MPTPLPAIMPPDYTETLNAFRTGQQDKLAVDKRNLMKQAGGLAAAGNYKGAMGALYKGGEFDEAKSMAGEIRSQSAEARAAASHARSMSNDQLEKASKGQELLGRLASTITTPEQLNQAKALLKARGLNVDSVTLDQLPMLKAQGLTAAQAYENERQERELAMKMEQAKLERVDKDRNYELNNRKVDLLGQKVAQGAAGKPLTEGQAKARSFLGTMQQAEAVMGEFMRENNAPPLSKRALTVYLNTPSWAGSTLLNKQERQYIQAMEQWVRAKLRKESGATIGSDEIRGEMQVYVPTSDEDAKTRAQKNAARLQAQKGLAIEGGEGKSPGQSNDLSTLSDDEILKGLSE